MQVGILTDQQNFFKRLISDTAFVEEELCDFLTMSELLNCPEDNMAVLLMDERYFADQAQLQLLKEKYPALQLLVLKESSKKAVFPNADDYISIDSLPEEISGRIYAALSRHQNQKDLTEECRFFRKAVKQEEELSTKLLDEYVSLKTAYQKMQNKNNHLVDTNRKLLKIARFDLLSGLLNRLSLTEQLDVEIDRCRREKQSLSCILLDIDDFKEINDTYGHPFGDEVIKQIGKIIRTHLRAYDAAARYGGEEFFILLPGTELKQACEIAERFRLTFQETSVSEQGKNLCLSASFGVAMYQPGETKEMWIKRADLAMYAAKNAGKNKVISE